MGTSILKLTINHFVYNLKLAIGTTKFPPKREKGKNNHVDFTIPTDNGPYVN